MLVSSEHCENLNFKKLRKLIHSKSKRKKRTNKYKAVSPINAIIANLHKYSDIVA